MVSMYDSVSFLQLQLQSHKMCTATYSNVMLDIANTNLSELQLHHLNTIHKPQHNPFHVIKKQSHFETKLHHTM